MPTKMMCGCICSGFLRVHCRYVSTKSSPALPDNDVSYLTNIDLYWYDTNMNLLYTRDLTRINSQNKVRDYAADIGLSVWVYSPPPTLPVGTTFTLVWSSHADLVNYGGRIHYDCGYVRTPSPGTETEIVCTEIVTEPNEAPHFYTDYIPVQYKWT